MKKELHPSWSEQDQAAGERMRQAWEEFFSGEKKAGESSANPFSASADHHSIAAVRNKHESSLMRYPNVIGVAEGVRMRRGKPTGEVCLVVYVERKVPRSKLSEDEILPSEIDGVRVDVVEVGRVGALPL